MKDIKTALERLAPEKGHYDHHATWGDDNGNSHIRATVMGPSLIVPVAKGKLTLGTWQQIVLIDFDTRSRNRQIAVTIMGL